MTQVIIPVQSKQKSGKEDWEYYYLAEVTATVTRSLKNKHGPEPNLCQSYKIDIWTMKQLQKNCVTALITALQNLAVHEIIACKKLNN